MKKRLRLLSLSLLILSSFSVASYSQTYVGMEQELKRHIEYLTSEQLKGRKTGSEGEKLASEYIFKELERGGIMMLTGEEGETFAILNGSDTTWSQNILCIVEGYDKDLRDEYIVIGAHYDHLGENTLNIDGKPVTQIYRGADDNASGVAVLIELAKQIAARPFLFRRSIVFVAFGAEEIGMAGSWYFLNRGLFKKEDIALMVNLDMVGRSGPSNPLMIYTILQNPGYIELYNNMRNRNLVAAPGLSNGNIFPSDHVIFYDSNIPVSLFSTGLHRDYHTIRDVPEHINYKGLVDLSEYLYFYLLEAANMDQRIDITLSGNNEVVTPEGEDRIYSPRELETPPRFMKGDLNSFMDRWVYYYLKYPVAPLARGIQGTVMVDFIIEKNGEVTNVKVSKGVDEDLDAEALRVVSASPKWKPGESMGQKVRVKYSIPVEFRLKSK